MRSLGYVLPYQIACEVCILIVVSLFQYDPIDREGIECPPATQNKDGVYQCKKHGSSGTLYYLISSLPQRLINFVDTGCNQCYGWKKQINRARTAAKKAGKK